MPHFKQQSTEHRPEKPFGPSRVLFSLDGEKSQDGSRTSGNHPKPQWKGLSFNFGLGASWNLRESWNPCLHHPCVIKQSSSASGQLGLQGQRQGALWQKLWSPPGPLTCYPWGQREYMRRTFYHITSPTLFSSISHLFLSLQTSTTTPSLLWMTSLLISLSN